MKKIITLIITTITFFSWSQTGSIWTKIPSEINFNSGRTDIEEVNQLIYKHSITNISKAFPASRKSELQEVYQIDCNCDENELLYDVSKMTDIFSKPEIGPHYQTLGLPNDYTMAFTNDWVLDKISAIQAWDWTLGDTSIVIAITDAGFYPTHEELNGKITLINDLNSTNPSHGTAVAISAAGNTNNFSGKSSIGFNSRLQLRSMDYNQIIEATYSGAQIINCSWASGCYSSYYAQEVINEVNSNGSIIVAAAGNGSTCGGPGSLVYPASYEHVISVTSVGPYDNHERFIGNSNSTHQHNLSVDICAPGYDVPLSTSPGQYLYGTGSSFAAPLVSGTIALMLSVNPCLTPDEVEQLLISSADTTIYLFNQNYNGLLGSGRLDANKAVLAAKNFNTFNVQISNSIDCNSFENILTPIYNTGTAPYQYNWSNGETTETISVVESGDYTLEMTDSQGCKNTTTIQIEKYNEINIEGSVLDVKCFGMNNGSIELSIFNGKPNYDIYWSNGQNNNIITDLSSGFYFVSVIDAAGCQKDTLLFVKQPEKLELEINEIQPNKGMSNGSINLIVSGGIVQYDFIWNNGQTTEDLNELPEGFYEVLVIDENECMASANIVLESQVETNYSTINELSYDVQIYPNPSVGLINIVFENPTTAKITDGFGKIVNTFENITNQTIQLNKAGVYYLNYNNTTKKITIL